MCLLLQLHFLLPHFPFLTSIRSLSTASNRKPKLSKWMEFIYLIRESKEFRCILIKGTQDSASSFRPLYSSFPAKGQTWTSAWSWYKWIGYFQAIEEIPSGDDCGTPDTFQPLSPLVHKVSSFESLSPIHLSSLCKGFNCSGTETSRRVSSNETLFRLSSLYQVFLK